MWESSQTETADEMSDVQKFLEMNLLSWFEEHAFWIVTPCSSEPDVSEEYIASVFRVEIKPSKKLADAGCKMSELRLENPAYTGQSHPVKGTVSEHCPF
jgi:hypothetical protein